METVIDSFCHLHLRALGLEALRRLRILSQSALRQNYILAESTLRHLVFGPLLRFHRIGHWL